MPGTKDAWLISYVDCLAQPDFAFHDPWLQVISAVDITAGERLEIMKAFLVITASRETVFTRSLL